MTQESQLNTANYFDSDRANRYNKQIWKIIPGYEALHNMAYALLGINLSKEANLLIVGSGTGTEIINLSQLNPQWQLMGVEPSPDMMAIAKRKLTEQGLSKQVKLHLGFTDELSESKLYNAATLILVMHFLPDDGTKLALLQNIAKRLKQGATFILADLHGDKDSKHFQDFIAAWKLYQLNVGVASAEDIEKNVQRRMKTIQFVTEARIIELLQTAGFNDIEQFYSAYSFRGWIAKFGGV